MTKNWVFTVTYRDPESGENKKNRHIYLNGMTRSQAIQAGILVAASYTKYEILALSLNPNYTNS